MSDLGHSRLLQKREDSWVPEGWTTAGSINQLVVASAQAVQWLLSQVGGCKPANGLSTCLPAGSKNQRTYAPAWAAQRAHFLHTTACTYNDLYLHARRSTVYHEAPPLTRRWRGRGPKREGLLATLTEALVCVHPPRPAWRREVAYIYTLASRSFLLCSRR